MDRRYQGVRNWIVALMLLAGVTGAGEPGANTRRASSADHPPRKVVIGTVVLNPGGDYPGLESRLKALGSIIDEMASQASKSFPGRGLDLAILPEDAVTSMKGEASKRAVALEGAVLETFSRLARKHKSYVIVPLDMKETSSTGSIVSNAAVLLDRQGNVAGIYRKAHPVALVGSQSLEGGVTPGKSFPVFDCDFGKLGIQICWDMVFDDGWQALADKGAEIVVWPSASPATIMPASRAAHHRYFIVSSTWRNNATVYEPTGMVAARVEEAGKVLVHELDLSHAILGWSSFLNNGQALTDKFGPKVGYHYDPREDIGLFWSNDPDRTIGEMIRSIGGEEIDRQIERNQRLQKQTPIR
jgi:predicted amidohydrolase